MRISPPVSALCLVAGLCLSACGDGEGDANPPLPADGGSDSDTADSGDSDHDADHPDVMDSSSPDAADAADASDAEIDDRLRVVLDTDANNELDDQHAIAYLLFNADLFNIEGITVNRTSGGGSIENHVAEADRVVQLCDAATAVPIFRGASGNFDEIRDHVTDVTFDGDEAVNFIIERALASTSDKLVLLPIGKLTNVALAMLKDPSIVPLIRVVWLGSNWPGDGEYNMDNDLSAVEYLIESDVDLEIVLVRYGEPSGTAAVQVTLDEIQQHMPGLGPHVVPPVDGRSGGTFSNFGDYSVELFRSSGSTSRALYDMAAVAVVKDPTWAEPLVMGAPELVGNGWQDRPGNPRTVTFWENFNRDAIVGDFFDRMENYILP